MGLFRIHSVRGFVNALWLMACNTKMAIPLVKLRNFIFGRNKNSFLVLSIFIDFKMEERLRLFAASGPGRCKINNGGCWQNSRDGHSYSACLVSDLQAFCRQSFLHRGKWVYFFWLEIIGGYPRCLFSGCGGTQNDNVLQDLKVMAWKVVKVRESHGMEVCNCCHF